MTRYCNLDYDREIAIVAAPKQDGTRLIGAVRLIVDADRKSGEFAVLVCDEWQGRGLGSKLMDSIVMVAKDMHLRSLYGDVLPSNYKMLRLMDAKGFKRETLDEDLVKVVLSLN